MVRVLLFAGVLAGCATRHDSSLDGPVHYEVQAFENTAHTTLVIEPDGQVTRTVESGSTTFELDVDVLARVAREVDAANFASLRPMYGCGGCADDGIYTVAVTVDGHAYSVQTDGRAVPAPLAPLITTLGGIRER